MKKKEENVEKIIKNLKNVEEKLEEICNVLEENGEVTINLFKKETMSLFPFQKSLDEVVEDIRLYRKSITEEKMNNIEENKVYVIKKAPNYFDEKEKEKIIGCYFVLDSVETNNNDGVTYFRGTYLTGGWRLPITIERNSLEEVDQTNKYTTYFYSGSGGILTLIEVECETKNAEDILAEGIKRLYKTFFDETTKKLKDNFFIISVEEAEELKEDEYYKKDYKKWKKGRNDNDNDFATFLMEEYRYVYFDIEDIGPIFVINGEYLNYRKGWGISGMSYRVNEELF